MEKIKNIVFNVFVGIVIGIVLSIFLFTNSCSKSSTSSDKVDTVHTSSDTLVKTKIDTFRDTLYITKRSKPDTIIKVKKDDHHVVHSTYKDSLLDAKVSTELKGEFLDQSMDYNLKSPRTTINRVDTIRIRDSIHTNTTKYKDPIQLGVGLEVEGSKTYFDIAPSISLEKDGIQVGYEYNILNRTHEIKLLKKIDLN